MPPPFVPVKGSILSVKIIVIVQGAVAGEGKMLEGNRKLRVITVIIEAVNQYHISRPGGERFVLIFKIQVPVQNAKKDEHIKIPAPHLIRGVADIFISPEDAEEIFAGKGAGGMESSVFSFQNAVLPWNDGISVKFFYKHM